MQIPKSGSMDHLEVSGHNFVKPYLPGAHPMSELDVGSEMTQPCLGRFGESVNRKAFASIRCARQTLRPRIRSAYSQTPSMDCELGARSHGPSEAPTEFVSPAMSLIGGQPLKSSKSFDRIPPHLRDSRRKTAEHMERARRLRAQCFCAGDERQHWPQHLAKRTKTLKQADQKLGETDPAVALLTANKENQPGSLATFLSGVLTAVAPKTLNAKLNKERSVRRLQNAVTQRNASDKEEAKCTCGYRSNCSASLGGQFDEGRTQNPCIHNTHLIGSSSMMDSRQENAITLQLATASCHKSRLLDEVDCFVGGTKYRAKDSLANCQPRIPTQEDGGPLVSHSIAAISSSVHVRSSLCSNKTKRCIECANSHDDVLRIIQRDLYSHKFGNASKKSLINSSAIGPVEMKNKDEAICSSGKTHERFCTDVERILRSGIHRKPFQLERRTNVALQIYERHFSPNSVEPVNIDNNTNKSIRDAIKSQNFTPQMYDVAQYQIFHLLKYDCWPRFLRAGGVAPSFEDICEESTTKQTRHRGDKKRKSLIWHSLRPKFTDGRKESSSESASSAQPFDNSTGSKTYHAAVTKSHSTMQPSPDVCSKFCTLMLDDASCAEQVALRDPTESVGKWTSTISAKRGMDPRATEVVDAQSGATIDPARQAIDALNNRCVRLLPVFYYAAEILASSTPSKTGICVNSRIILIRVRNSLPLDAILRPLLGKYLIDPDSCVVVVPGSMEIVSSLKNSNKSGQRTIGSLGQHFFLVMTQQQYQEKKSSPKRETVRDIQPSQLLNMDLNLPFYQHGDVAFVEIPPDVDLRTGKIAAARTNSNTKTDHSSGIMKFVRKASHAVTSRDTPDASALPSTMQHQHRHHYSQSMPATYNSDKGMKESLSSFQRASSEVLAGEIPYCGEDTANETFRFLETENVDARTTSIESEVVDYREKIFEIPDFLKKENSSDAGQPSKNLPLICSGIAKIPSLYTTTIPSETDFTPVDRKESLIWQRADYV